GGVVLAAWVVVLVVGRRTLPEKWRRQGSGVIRWWWRVKESGVEDRVDRETRNLFGFAEKIPPEKFSDGGRVVAGGGGRKPLIFSWLATMDPPGDIMARTTSLKRCLTLISIGPQSIVMTMTWSNLVTLVNVREKFRNEMKCLKIPSKFARFLTFGASISWGRSHFHKGTIIYLWPSITCQNRLKQKRSPPTTPELWADKSLLHLAGSQPMLQSLKESH
nr:hypothetical protein [Tanacetum cinerariifolium]